MKRLAATVMWWQARPTGFITTWCRFIRGQTVMVATHVLRRTCCFIDGGRPHFSWGGATHASDDSALRDNYLTALRAADAGSFDELFRFARS